VTGDREGAMAERRHHLDLVQRAVSSGTGL
jgi:hypothetical protein